MPRRFCTCDKNYWADKHPSSECNQDYYYRDCDGDDIPDHVCIEDDVHRPRWSSDDHRGNYKETFVLSSKKCLLDNSVLPLSTTTTAMTTSPVGHLGCVEKGKILYALLSIFVYRSAGVLI